METEAMNPDREVTASSQVTVVVSGTINARWLRHRAAT